MALSRCMNLDNLELDHSSFGYKPKLTTIDLVGGIYCSLCWLILPNKKAFDSHYRTHTTEIANIVYTCVVCMKQFGTYPIFRDHCYNIHVTKEKFKCKHCDKNFSKGSVLLGHIKSVHTLQCQECAQSFTSKEDLQLHKTMSHKKEDKFPYPCSACGHKIYSADACEQHIDEISIITFPCPICQDILPTKPEAIKHVLKHFDISEDINIDESDEPNFVEDSSIDMLGVQCCYCKAMLKNRMEINVHICEEHPGAVVVYTCNICHKQYPAAKYNTFVDHCYAHLTRNKYECTECDKSFPRLSLFVVHTEACHTSPGSTLCEDPDDAKPYKCWCCPHSFQTERRLTFHLRHQHKAKDLCCDEYGCYKTFLSLKDLLIHQREHKQTSKNLCRFCGLQFVSLASCTNHIEVHRIKNYGCPICPNKYKEKHTLVKHIPFHFECVLHICKICGKSYNAKNRLIQHSKTHSEARTYKCEHCGKGFFKPHELQQHVNVHTGMKPYKCMVCLKAFASYPNWTKHVRKVHNIDVKKYKKELQNYPQPINNVETVKMIPTESMDNKKVDEINNCRVDSMKSEISTEVSLESEDSTMDSIASSTLEKKLEIIKNNIQCMDGDFADILSPTDTFMDSEMDATPQPLAASTYPTEIGPDFITLDGDNPNGEFINLDENILLPYIDPLLTIKCENGRNENAMNKNIDRDINYSIDYSNIHIDNNVNWEPPVYTFNPYYLNDLTDANILSIMDNMF